MHPMDGKTNSKAESEIVGYLRETYRPIAIILHGSRAIGMSRLHSDWDIFLLFHQKPARIFNREEIAGQDVEWEGIEVPVADKSLLDTFGVKLQFGKVLWEEGTFGTTLLKQASSMYARGPVILDANRRQYKQFMQHKINGMEDDLDTPYMFLRHLSVFFDKAVNWWMELYGQQYRKPFYIAVPQIEKEDPAYYALLMTLCGDEPKEKKIEAAKKIVELFPWKKP